MLLISKLSIHKIHFMLFTLHLKYKTFWHPMRFSLFLTGNDVCGSYHLLLLISSLLPFIINSWFISSPEHEVLMVSYCGQWLSVVRRRPSSVVRRASSVVRRASTFDVYTLETTFVTWVWWNLIRMFVLTIARLSSNMGHVGSKTRSPGQILENSCLHPRGHICDPILIKLCQNVCFDNI